MLYRSQQGITLAITEEFWVKNIINIFISPISLAELLAAICIVGIIKSLVTTIVLALLASIFYKFNLLSVGPGLVLFIGNLLLFGWAVGLFTMAGPYLGCTVSHPAHFSCFLSCFRLTGLAAEDSLPSAVDLRL